MRIFRERADAAQPAMVQALDIERSFIAQFEEFRAD